MAVDDTLVAAQLADAKAQYHKLLTGQLARVFVDQNGERVEFTASNKTDLYNYIQQLQAILTCPAPRRPNAPLRFLF